MGGRDSPVAIKSKKRGDTKPGLAQAGMLTASAQVKIIG